MWTPKQDAFLLNLLARGLSATEVGRRMNVSRNAVLGRVHRIKGTQFPSYAVKAERERRKREASKAERAEIRRKHKDAVDRMLEAIGSGGSRTSAIKQARSEGVPLRMIGAAIGLTGERVRQLTSDLAA